LSIHRHLTDRLREHENGRFANFLRSLLDGVPWSECAERSDDFTLKAPASGSLRINNPNGRTSVVGSDRDDIEVRACKRARAESSEAAANLLEQIKVSSKESAEVLMIDVEAPKRWNRRGQVFLQVSIPRSLRIEVNAVNGRIDIDCIRGGVIARSANGSANISDVVGDIEIATSNAKVACNCTCGKIVARSSNGKIVLEGHRGSVDATTSNGLIRVSLDAIGKGGVILATSNGRIALELPEEIDADVDLRVDNGVIRNERSLCKASREGNGVVRGRLGKGGTLIKLRTSNGSISLK
jgi:DUF4097 and DUF4098 domain-containing protein YvlB